MGFYWCWSRLITNTLICSFGYRLSHQLSEDRELSHRILWMALYHPPSIQKDSNRTSKIPPLKLKTRGWHSSMLNWMTTLMRTNPWRNVKKMETFSRVIQFGRAATIAKPETLRTRNETILGIEIGTLPPLPH